MTSESIGVGEGVSHACPARRFAGAITLGLDAVVDHDSSGGEETDLSDARSARYVAIVADGNRRWARARRLSMSEAHDAAADTLRHRVLDAAELGVRELTVYVFSTENWSRPVAEVQGLMEMFARRIPVEAAQLHREGIRVRLLGRREGLSDELSEQIELVHSPTVANARMTLYLAFNYGGRAEILHAARRFAGATEESFRSCLFDPQMHDPELIIRSGGEQRLSNFLLWQSAYSELVFRDELWPDFTRLALEESLWEFRRRARRFGGR
jgi:undecaprenyl diphosphate synthase